MAAKKISAKSKKTSAKKGARKVSSTTPRGMARRFAAQPPAGVDGQLRLLKTLESFDLRIGAGPGSAGPPRFTFWLP